MRGKRIGGGRLTTDDEGRRGGRKLTVSWDIWGNTLPPKISSGFMYNDHPLPYVYSCIFQPLTERWGSSAWGGWGEHITHTPYYWIITPTFR